MREPSYNLSMVFHNQKSVFSMHLLRLGFPKAVFKSEIHNSQV